MQKQSTDAVSRPPSLTVVNCVADRESVDVATLPPLYESIDPDALDKLIEREGYSPFVQVQFEYHGYDVTVGRDGVVRLDRRDGR
jgi:hypothetical protein